ncbi:MAG: cation/multidrug efflux pump [Gammaproteobacteria bacterium]|nr:MAG: cation/multidrug efflux pump [Gammaproteobacteria bacterium]TND06682.1 MAG: cation/multidrug efflux pump [Gammaproteobacteria bacterium]
MRSLIEFFVQRGLLVNLVSIMLLGGGLYAASHIQREAFPSVNFDIVGVGAGYPGTSPREIESLLVTPIERELKGIDGIKAVSSTAYPGMMQLTIEIDPNYADRSRLVADVQQAIDRADLPADLPADPVITEVKSEQTPILSFTIFGDYDPLSLKRLSDRIEDDVMNLPGVANVLVQGKRKQEIRIVLDPERMRRHRIAVNDVVRLIQGWNVNAPGGQIKIPNNQKTVRITGEFVSAEDAAGLVIRANERGDALRLKDVADVIDTLERPTRLVGAQGEPAVNMIVLKKGDADLINLVDRIRAYLKTVPERYGNEVNVRIYNDFSTVTRLRLRLLTGNGAFGLLLVTATLLLFLRPAVALTTAWGLPVIFFAGLLVLYLGGVTLNLLTMFGFIMVLGMLVDDAIIIGENITWHMENGMPPEQAAVTGTMELIGPVTATVLTTVVAFLPLMFMQGIVGKFVFAIPVVVITLLMFSWLEAIFVLPNHIRDVARANKRPRERWLFRWLSVAYEWLLRVAVRWRYLTIILTILALGATFTLAGNIKFQLFPPGAESQFYLRVKLPTGTTLEQTEAALQRLDREVRSRIDPEILETTTMVAGENSADQRETLKQIGDRFGFLRVVLMPFTERDIPAYDVMNVLEREVPSLFPDMEISFVMEVPGPPVGRALQVEITGRDVAAQQRAARRLMSLLAGVKGAHAVESDLEYGDPEIHIELDRSLAAFAGVDLATVAQHIKAAFDGLRVSTLKHGKQEVDVTIRYSERAQRDAKTLLNLEIPNNRGGLVPLHKIARVTQHPGTTSIRHKNNSRVINVSTDVDPQVITSRELNALVKKRDAEWLADDAPVLEYHLGGAQERDEESVKSLVFSFGYALFGIFLILAIQFNRIAYPLLVMLSIPFGLIGIVCGFYLHGQPLSFMALMGFVALSGVVVNSSLVMAVFIQRLISQGTEWRVAVIEAGKRRLRAVLLTALTTVVGLLPTAYGWGGLDPFVAPMALALSWGLMFSTVITLFSIPAALGIGMDVKAGACHIRALITGKQRGNASS